MLPPAANMVASTYSTPVLFAAAAARAPLSSSAMLPWVGQRVVGPAVIGLAGMMILRYVLFAAAAAR